MPTYLLRSLGQRARTLEYLQQLVHKTRPFLRRALKYLPSFMSSSEAGQDAYLGHWVSAPARLNTYSCCIKPGRSLRRALEYLPSL